MSRRKTDKFFIHAARKSGKSKGKRLLGVNHSYGGGTENVTFQDLVEFLKEKNIDPSTIVLPSSLMMEAKV